jgi:TonB family protein
MTITRATHLIAFAALSWLALGRTAAANDDALARAKDLYLAASYDEALAVLNGLPGGISGPDGLQIAEYRVFCLLALDRGPEARKAIEGLVKANPFYRPSEAQTSPRIRSLIQDVRRGLLPSMVQGAYAEAKAAFDRKDPRAAAQFEHVIALLADPDLGPGMSDLRTVAAGFRDLSRAAATPAATPTAPPPLENNPAALAAPGNPGSATPGLGDDRAPASSAEGNGPRASAARPPAGSASAAAKGGTAPSLRPERELGVIPPEAVFQPMPTWTPATPAEAAQTFRGSLELSIDENGRVVSARMRKGVHPRYDDLLVKAAQAWKFKPARRDGASTSYVRVVEIELRPSR